MKPSRPAPSFQDSPRFRKIVLGVVVAALCIAPIWIYPVLLMKLLCFALFACAFNLLTGYTGMLSFGHAAFFGGAAYITGYVLRDWHWPMLAGIAAGMVVSGLLGLIMGLLATRRQGIYFTMITLALSQLIYFFALQAPFTGGEDGLQGVPRGTLAGINLSDDFTLYYVVAAIAVAGWMTCVRIVRSPFGQVVQAIRDNSDRATSLGYTVTHYKVIMFVLSAILAGLAGALQTVVMGFATLTDVHWTMSGLVVLMTLLGGLGTLVGPIVGAVLVIMLENKLGDIGNWLAKLSGIEWFAGLGEAVTIVTGIIFIICVMLLRRGIVGEWVEYLKRSR